MYCLVFNIWYFLLCTRLLCSVRSMIYFLTFGTFWYFLLLGTFGYFLLKIFSVVLLGT